MITAIKNFSKNQKGFVSIVVTMIIMIVLSLIVIGFAKLVRRDQRQALDKQLNTQAFYAAETGVNDATKVIKDALATDPSGASLVEKTDCAPGGAYATSNIVDSDTNLSYSCLLVDPSPRSLEYSNVDTTNSTVVPVSLKSGQTIDELTIGWQAKDGNTNFNCPGNAPGYPALHSAGAGGWTCGTGILRVDLTPFNGAQSRSSLSSSNMTRFLYPLPAGLNSVAYGANTQPDTVEVKCDASASPRYCVMTFDNVNSQVAYLRLKSIYVASSVSITCTTVSGATCEMVGTQAHIDSTGKANDVLRRIQVRLPLRTTGILPENAISTTDSICKRYVVVNDVSISDPDDCDPAL